MPASKPQPAQYPNVSTTLAARLRASYRRLSDARSSLAWHEAKGAFTRWYLARYEQDPLRFAQLHYPGQGPSSYPVVTHIGRHYEWLERSEEERLPYYQELLPKMEVATIQVEEEVRIAVLRLRPSTKRELWPARPLSLERERKSARNFPQNRIKDELKREEKSAARQATDTAQRTREKAAFDVEFVQLLAEAQHRMPPEVFELHRNIVVRLKGLHDEGLINVFRIAGGDMSSIQKALDESKQEALDALTTIVHETPRPAPG